MATVFTAFREQPYKYLVISRGTVEGNVVTETKNLNGIVKLRKGFTRSGNNMETFGTDLPTIHAHPEDFDADDVIVGNGVQVNGSDYEITGLTVGTNFITGEVEHYTLTLREAELAFEELPNVSA